MHSMLLKLEIYSWEGGEKKLAGNVCELLRVRRVSGTRGRHYIVALPWDQNWRICHSARAG